MDIVQFFESVVADAEQVVSISNIEPTATGYTIFCNTERIKPYTAVELNAGSLSGEFEVKSVNEISFTIETEITADATTGTAKNIINFYFDYFDNAKSRQAETYYLDIARAKSMPLFLVFADIEIKVTNNIHEPNFVSYIIFRTNENETNEQRSKSVMSYLDILKIDFLRAFEKSEYTLGNFSHSEKKIFYNSSQDSAQNELSEIVDAIQLRPVLKLLNIKKC